MSTFRKSIKKRHKITTTLFIIIASSPFCTAAKSAEYYWHGAAVSYSYPYIENPVSFCLGLVKDPLVSNPRYHWLNSQGHEVNPGPDIQGFRCIYDHAWYLSPKDIGLQRNGESCAPSKEYNYTTGECGNDKQKGNDDAPQACNLVGNPINLAVGNKLYKQTHVKEREGIPFAAYYNGLDGKWRHEYSAHLRASADTQVVIIEDGRELFFHGNKIEMGTGSLTPTESGWQYDSRTKQYLFDAAGRLTQIKTKHGVQYNLTYSEQTITITSSLGLTAKVKESYDHRPLEFSTTDLWIGYEYNSNRALSKLERRHQDTLENRVFHYEAPHNSQLLTGITDERGIRYATWTYDDQGRAISSEHAGGAEKVLINYNADGSSTVTNELGKQTVYRFQVIQGVKRITAIEGEPSPNCPNSNSTFTYDERGLLKTKTDNKGHLTTYDYNDRGLEISRTEAAGTAQARTITTEWHPEFFLPAMVTEPDRITQYAYDTHGRQTSQSVTPR